MKKKIALIASVIALMSAFTACGTSKDSKSSKETTQATEAETTTEATEAEGETTTDAEAETTEETTKESGEKPSKTAEKIKYEPVEGLSENYADLENRSFAYDGKIYTLGKSTLKDLIDGGIPFDEDELNNKGNNVNKNYETGRYTVKINDHVSLQFVFMNSTDGNLTEEECLLSTVRWYTIYVPQPDYDESLNEEITASLNDAAEHISFSFPFDLTKEQLLENNADTTEEDEYNNVEYKVKSEVYMGSSGYSFSFEKNTNQLKDVSVTWIP